MQNALSSFPNHFIDSFKVHLYLLTVKIARIYLTNYPRLNHETILKLILSNQLNAYPCPQRLYCHSSRLKRFLPILIESRQRQTPRYNGLKIHSLNNLCNLLIKQSLFY